MTATDTTTDAVAARAEGLSREILVLAAQAEDTTGPAAPSG